MVPIGSTLTGDSESVLECFLLTNRTLSDECSTISPVGSVLKDSMPMLSELHEDAVRKRRCIVTYYASFQGHCGVREFIENLNRKIIAL